eukprot:1737615-Rhodomonas_salina.2
MADNEWQEASNHFRPVVLDDTIKRFKGKPPCNLILHLESLACVDLNDTEYQGSTAATATTCIEDAAEALLSDFRLQQLYSGQA